MNSQDQIDLAPGWTIRCPKCGLSKPYGAARWGKLRPVRLMAASLGKRTLGWRRQCRALRWAIVEWTGIPAESEAAKPLPAELA